MKRTLLVISLCTLAGFSFAQKKNVKEAKNAMKSNVAEARELIKSALVDPETKNDPETWKVAGDIEYNAFDVQFVAEQTKTLVVGSKGADEELMYSGLYNLYAPYLKADELGQIPDEKGKVKNKVRKDVVKVLKDTHPFLINGGAYYSEKREYVKAADLFERYWNTPSLEIMKGDAKDFNTQDTLFQTIKYYSAISSIQAANAFQQAKDSIKSREQHVRAIKLLNRIIAEEPYMVNTTYKESDPYEYLAEEYKSIGDSVSYTKTLLEGSNKFPKNQYFTPNLINEYIKGGRAGDALTFIDQAIANNPSNTCDLSSVKASLFIEQKAYDKAFAAYTTAFASDANCERAHEGEGVLYVIQAQEMRDKSSSASRSEQVRLDKEAAELYVKALTHLEKYKDLLYARGADADDKSKAVSKLQNVYYNLSYIGVNKDKEYEESTKELERLKNEF